MARSQRTSRWLACADRLGIVAVVAGTLLAVVYIGASLAAAHAREEGIASFEAAKELSALERPPVRVAAAEPAERAVAPSSKGPAADGPEGILRIPALGVTVPVFTGTDEPTLMRGAGRVEWSAPIGAPGNVGIAAHRDGAFAPLKHIALGNRVLLESAGGTLQYEVVDFFVVAPEDVHVLDPREEPYVTLITCYPFNFVGAAPRRFIVHARLARAEAAEL